MKGIVFLYILKFCVSIYEEQFGEFDWRLENIGYVERAFYGNRIYVTTEDGVIARLKAKSRNIEWRLVLPQGEKVMEMVLGPGRLYAVCSDGVIRCVDMLSGTILWDSPLPGHSEGRDIEKILGQRLPTGLFLDSVGEGTVVVLANNRVAMFSVLGENLITMSPDNVPIEMSDTLNPLRAGTWSVLLSHLVPFQFISGRTQIAIGCLVPVSGPLNCLASAVLESDVRLRTGKVLTYAPLPVPPLSLRGVFGPSDHLLMGLSPEGLHLLPLGSQRLQTLSLPIPASTGLWGTPILAVMEGADPEGPGAVIVPVLSMCWERLDNGRHNCSSFVINAPKAAFTPLVSCEGAVATGGWEPHPSSAQLVLAAACVSREELPVGALDRRAPASALLRIRIADLARETSEEVATWEPMPRSLRALHVGRVSDPKRSKIASVEVRALVQTGAGALLSVSERLVQWVSSEGLARVRAAVLVDRPLLDGRTATAAATEEGMPDLITRLDMHWEELQSATLSLPSTVLSLLQRMVAPLLPSPPRDHAALLQRREVEGAQFGFDKLSVCLCARVAVDWTEAVSVPWSTVSSAGGLETFLGLQVAALDVLQGALDWTFEPSLDGLWALAAKLDASLSAPPLPSTMLTVRSRLLPIRLTRRGSLAPLVALMLSVERSDLGPNSALSAFWVLDVASGTHVGMSSSLAKSSSGSLGEYAGAPSLVMVGPVVLSVAALPRDGHADAVFVLTHEGASASLFPPESTARTQTQLRGHFLHTFNRDTGLLQSFQIASNQSSLSAPCAVLTKTGPVLCAAPLLSSRAVASALLDPALEQVVAVAYPVLEAHSLSGPSRATVLGDDSLLLKYLNPRLVALAAVETDPSEGFPTLSLTLLDTVSARVVYRVSVRDGGCGPVRVRLVEHRVLLTYWNCRVQRAELLSVALFEGMLGKYALGPFSPVSSSKPLSAFTAYPPIAMEKSFVLPRGVQLLERTYTGRGLANKDLLLVFSNGQVVAMDMRAVDPRRPLAPPSNAEKEEGLFQYTPHLHPDPMEVLSLNGTVQHPRLLTAGPSGLESTGLVMVAGLDLLFNRVSPSGAFDLLASDFNRPLLVATLLALSVGTVVLRHLHRNRICSQGWA